MKISELEIKGAYILELEPINDNRGFFARKFCKKELKEKIGINFEICQANVSYNKKKGTIRGLHYQKSPYEETKIISCVKGKIFDVVLDLRENSPTYLQWYGVELSENNFKMLIIPKGCAHGFQSLEDDTILNYFVDQYFTPSADSGYKYNDPAFNIKWPINNTIIISDKDLNAKDFKE